MIFNWIKIGNNYSQNLQGHRQISGSWATMGCIFSCRAAVGHPRHSDNTHDFGEITRSHQGYHNNSAEWQRTTVHYMRKSSSCWLAKTVARTSIGHRFHLWCHEPCNSSWTTLHKIVWPCIWRLHWFWRSLQFGRLPCSVEAN